MHQICDRRVTAPACEMWSAVLCGKLCSDIVMSPAPLHSCSAKVETSRCMMQSLLDDGKFCGLALDEDNEDDKTEGRIKAWVEQLKGEGF